MTFWPEPKPNKYRRADGGGIVLLWGLKPASPRQTTKNRYFGRTSAPPMRYFPKCCRPGRTRGSIGGQSCISVSESVRVAGWQLVEWGSLEAYVRYGGGEVRGRFFGRGHFGGLRTFERVTSQVLRQVKGSLGPFSGRAKGHLGDFRSAEVYAPGGSLRCDDHIDRDNRGGRWNDCHSGRAAGGG
jgi:hypothetical protein